MRHGQPTLDHLPQVQQQVPAIGDLNGRGRPEPDAAGVLARAVTGDSPDSAGAPEPVGQCRRAPVRQQADDPPPLQVDENGPVGLTFAQGPVIDAHKARGWAPPGPTKTVSSILPAEEPILWTPMIPLHQMFRYEAAVSTS